MNKDRRKAIDEALALVDAAKQAVDTARQAVEEIRDEEQDYYDNMPESFQNGSKGENAQAAIDQLDYAASELDGFDFDAITGYLEEAKGY